MCVCLCLCACVCVCKECAVVHTSSKDHNGCVCLLVRPVLPCPHPEFLQSLSQRPPLCRESPDTVRWRRLLGVSLSSEGVTHAPANQFSTFILYFLVGSLAAAYASTLSICRCCASTTSFISVFRSVRAWRQFSFLLLRVVCVDSAPPPSERDTLPRAWLLQL